MKKIFTLLFSLGMITAAFAQSNRWNNNPGNRYDSRTVIVNQNHPMYDHQFDRRDEMIRQINQEFEYKIARVQRSFFMSRWEKQRQIRMLEMQREQQIREVSERFSHGWDGDRRNRY